MNDFLLALSKTPIPVLLITTGIVFLFVSVGGQIRTILDTTKIKPNISLLIGILFISTGLIIQFVPTEKEEKISVKPVSKKKQKNIGVTHTHNGIPHTHPLPSAGIHHSHKNKHNHKGELHEHSLTSTNLGHSHENERPARPVTHSHDRIKHVHLLFSATIRHTHAEAIGEPTPIKHLHNGKYHTHPLPLVLGLEHAHGDGALGRSASDSIMHLHGRARHSHPLPSLGVAHSHGSGLIGRSSIDFNSPNQQPQKMSPSGYYEGYKDSKVEEHNGVKHTHKGIPHTHPLPSAGIHHSHTTLTPSEKKEYKGVELKHTHKGIPHTHRLPSAGLYHTHTQPEEKLSAAHKAFIVRYPQFSSKLNVNTCDNILRKNISSGSDIDLEMYQKNNLKKDMFINYYLTTFYTPDGFPFFDSRSEIIQSGAELGWSDEIKKSNYIIKAGGRVKLVEPEYTDSNQKWVVTAKSNKSNIPGYYTFSVQYLIVYDRKNTPNNTQDDEIMSSCVSYLVD